MSDLEGWAWTALLWAAGALCAALAVSLAAWVAALAWGAWAAVLA